MKIPIAKTDEIVKLNYKFKHDPRIGKINLVIGELGSPDGRIYEFRSVQKNLEVVSPLSGYNSFHNKTFERLILTYFLPYVEQKEGLSEDALLFPTAGGTHANSLTSQLLEILGMGTIHFPEQTWGNHLKIFKNTGLNSKTMPYVNKNSYEIDISGMISYLEKNLKKNEIVSFDACCHNPTGLDLNEEQQKKVIKIIKEKEAYLFFDVAYSGLSSTIEKDISMMKKAYEASIFSFIAFSFSKNMGLYSSRIGAMAVVSKELNKIALKPIITNILRTTISFPSDSYKIVIDTLGNNFEEWNIELAHIREELNSTKKKIGTLFGQNAGEVNGFFLLSDLSEKQIEQLKDEHGIYILKNGRVNLSGINDENFDRIKTAVNKVREHQKK